MAKTIKSKIRKVILTVLLLPIILVMIVILLLYVPFVQTSLINYTTKKLSETIGLDVKVGAINIGFPLDLELKNLVIIKPQGDTILNVGKLITSAELFPLINNRVAVPYLLGTDVNVNLSDTTGLFIYKTSLKNFNIHKVFINLKDKKISVNDIYFSNTNVYLNDIDTIEKPDKVKNKKTEWEISAGSIKLDSTKVFIYLKKSNVYVNTKIESIGLKNVKADTYNNIYKGDKILLYSAKGQYAHTNNPQRVSNFFDYSNIEFMDTNIEVEKFYNHLSTVKANVKVFKTKEKSGLVIDDLSVNYSIDSTGITAQNINLKTLYSNIKGNIVLPWNVLKNNPLSKVKVQLSGDIDIEEICKVTAFKFNEDSNLYNRLFATDSIGSNVGLNLDISGSLRNLKINNCSISIDNSLSIGVKGEAHNLSIENKRMVNIDYQIFALDKINVLINKIKPSLSKKLNIPKQTNILGTINIKNREIVLKTSLYKKNTEQLYIDGKYNLKSTDYDLLIKTYRLDLNNYLPKLDFSQIDLYTSIRGTGFDIKDKKNSIAINTVINNAKSGNIVLNNMSLDGAIKKGIIELSANSMNPELNLGLHVDGLIDSKYLNTSFTLQVDSIDNNILSNKIPFSVKGLLQGELRSDYKLNNKIDLLVKNFKLLYNKDVISPQNTELSIKTDKQLIEAKFTSGKDWNLYTSIETSVDKILSKLDSIKRNTSLLVEQVLKSKSSYIDVNTYLLHIPSFNIKIKANGYNPLKKIINKNYIDWSTVSFDAVLDSTKNLNINSSISDLKYNNVKLNYLSLKAETISKKESDGILTKELFAGLDIINNSYNQKDGFKINSSLLTDFKKAEISTLYKNEKNVDIYKVLLYSYWQGDTYKISLGGEDVILSGKTYEVNKDNFLTIDKTKYYLNSKIFLSKAARPFFTLTSNYSKSHQDIYINLTNFELSDLQDFGFLSINGILSADIKYNRDGEINNQPTITADLSLINGKYKSNNIGHVTSTIFYEPRDNKYHYVTTDITYDGNSILSIEGIYSPLTTSNILGNVYFKNLPLSIVDIFLKDQNITTNGFLNGNLFINGKLSKPNMRGKINLDSTIVNLKDYSMNLLIGNNPIVIENNIITFNRFPIYSANTQNNPLTIDGNITINDFNDIYTDIKLNAQNMVVFDNPTLYNYHQTLYGKLILSSNISLRGKLNELKIRGGINILGGTNANYVIQKNKLTERNNFDNIIEFTDLRDTVFVKDITQSNSLRGVDVFLNLNIDPSVRLGINFTPDHANYLRIQGGGNLTFRAPEFGEMSLTGKYEMNDDGKLKYTIPVVGVTFDSELSKDSYINWNGNISNPYLDFRAFSHIKANTTNEDGKSTQTNFVVSLSAKDYINNINVGFDLNAPENIKIQNQLAQMSKDERGKQAISLLTTGIYLAGTSASNNNSFDVNNTLTNILQTQINKATGTLLQGTDINIGMEHHSAQDGLSAYTDYNYSVSKRLLNDKIRIILGGKLQTGNIPTNSEQTLIDNLSVEYKIDNAGQQYLSLFRKRVTDDILEGEYTETGGSYLLRRKTKKFIDLFHLFDKGENKKDTLKTKNNSTLFKFKKD